MSIVLLNPEEEHYTLAFDCMGYGISVHLRHFCLNEYDVMNLKPLSELFLINFPNLNIPARILITPARKTAASMYSTPWLLASGTITTATAPVAPEIIPVSFKGKMIHDIPFDVVRIAIPLVIPRELLTDEGPYATYFLWS